MYNIKYWDEIIKKLTRRNSHRMNEPFENHQEIKSVSTSSLKIVSDEPITKNGSLGFSKFSIELASLIENSSPRFSIGIFGNWGTGKTSLMRMVFSELDKRKTILPVWFDAWRYEREEYSALIPFLRTININLENSANKHRRWRDVKKGLKSTFNAYMESSKVSIGLKEYGSVETDLGNFMNTLKTNGSAVINNKLIRYYEHITDHFAQSLLNIRKKDDQFKIVVFIDDLDRCTPEKALDVLESIKSFFDIEGIVFVVGMNYDSINNIIRQKYGKNSGVDGFEYMQKIVQLHFQIPSLTEEDISDLLKDILQNSLRESGLDLFSLSEHHKLLIKAVKKTPREIKRFINNITLSKTLFDKPVDELIAVQALSFRHEWNWFLDFITPDNVRTAFFEKYLKLRQEVNFKELMLKDYPYLADMTSFFNKDDPLRIFLDSGSAAEILFRINVMREHRRVLESVVEASSQIVEADYQGQKQEVKIMQQNIGKILTVLAQKSVEHQEMLKSLAEIIIEALPESKKLFDSKYMQIEELSKEIDVARTESNITSINMLAERLAGRKISQAYTLLLLAEIIIEALPESKKLFDSKYMQIKRLWTAAMAAEGQAKRLLPMISREGYDLNSLRTRREYKSAYIDLLHISQLSTAFAQKMVEHQEMLKSLAEIIIEALPESKKLFDSKVKGIERFGRNVEVAEAQLKILRALIPPQGQADVIVDLPREADFNKFFPKARYS